MRRDLIPAALAGAICLSLLAARAGADDLSPQAINQRIQKYRTAQVTLTLTDAGGAPQANAAVVIRQTRHRFLFGSNIFALRPQDSSPLQQAYQKRFAEIFNFATLGFYWGAYERAAGQTSADRLAAMADWCNAHGIRPKGHPLCWQQVFPGWLMKSDLEEVQKQQLGRITREVGGFAGKIDTWDVVNEAVSMPRYDAEPTRVPELCRRLGQVQLLKACFSAARAANPKATLLLNDYNTGPQYEKLIGDALQAGVSIDVIGIQSHQHTGFWGARRAWEVCQRFAKFGKPIHFTETTIISGRIRNDIRWQGPRHNDWPTTPADEQRQMQQVVEFYTVLFSHPSVQAITWWDFSDHGAWLGAPSGLLHADMTPKPAYEALLKKIKGEWWTGEVKATTDASGRVTFRGFLGDYALESGNSKATFSLDAPGAQTVRVQLP